MSASWEGYAGLVLVVSCAHIVLQLYRAVQRSVEGLRRANEELAASRARVVAAADAERARIERDLHDGAQQQLTCLAVRLGLAAAAAGPDPELAGLLAGLGGEVQQTARQLRHLVHGIYPPLLRQAGLGAALAEAAAACPRPVTVRAAGAGRYPGSVEAAVYFCCLEAVQNACKHAGPRAVIGLRVREQAGALTFEVTDDGAGFDTTAGSLGAGLRNMADRMGAFGGRLVIESAPGHGTRVTGTVPVPAGPAAGRGDQAQRPARELVG